MGSFQPESNGDFARESLIYALSERHGASGER